jgi:hypothetical protein
MSVYDDEIFGPVLSVVRVGTYEEAVPLVNSNPCRNGVAVFTRDGGVARRFELDIEVGMVGVNVAVPVPVGFHSFSGWKASLFGDSAIYGPEGIRFYTRQKVVTTRWPDPATSKVDLGLSSDPMIAAWRVELAHRTAAPEPDHNTVVHNTVGGQVHIDTAAREGHDVLTVSDDGPTGHPLIPSASQIQRRQRFQAAWIAAAWPAACRLPIWRAWMARLGSIMLPGASMSLKSGSTATSRLVWRSGANSASGVTEAANEPPPPEPWDPRGWQERTTRTSVGGAAVALR